jgi:actin-related protein
MQDNHVVVVDTGSSSTKIGLSEEDSPSYVFPTNLSSWSRTIEVF